MKEFFGKYKNLYVTVPFLLCFILYLGALSKYKPPGAYIWRGDLTEGFLRDEFEGLIFGGAYIWRGLFSEFYGILSTPCPRVSIIKRLSWYEFAPKGRDIVSVVRIREGLYYRGIF